VYNIVFNQKELTMQDVNVMTIEELTAYIAALEAEIARRESK
jgi:uncharacterized small protein (DUF1192 family)